MAKTKATEVVPQLKAELEAERQRYKLQLLQSELLQTELDRKERLIVQLRSDLLKGVRAAKKVQPAPRPVAAPKIDDSTHTLDHLAKDLLKQSAPSSDEIRRFLIATCGKVMTAGQSIQKRLQSEKPLREALEKALRQCKDDELLKNTRRVLDHAGVVKNAE